MEVKIQLYKYILMILILVFHELTRINLCQYSFSELFLTDCVSLSNMLFQFEVSWISFYFNLLITNFPIG